MTDTTSATQATPATLSGRIATWVTALRYEDLPEEVVERTKLLILDQLGLQLRGATLPNVQPVLRLADSEPGKAEATLAHSGARTTVSQAAWVNGTLGHSAEYDDAHSTALLTTLEEFLSRRGTITATAEALYIHPNTLRQRLRRIMDLTGLDLRKEDWLMVEIAVKLAALQRAMQGRPDIPGAAQV